MKQEKTQWYQFLYSWIPAPYRKSLKWVPTLYFSEGLPNVIVMTVAVTMYMQLGMSDTEIALYTSWLGLPWVIKPLWSPFIDIFKTKRWWVLAMQVLLASSFGGIAFTLNASFWFQGTMFFFFLMAFSSATHDIAADGFYMIELDSHQQSFFVGIRNFFYRVAVIFGQGALVPLAGGLQLIFRNQIAFTWSLIFYGLAGLMIAIWLYHGFILPRPTEQNNAHLTARQVMHSVGDTLVTFFKKQPWRGMVIVLLFLMFYRFPEALLLKMSTTFLQRPNSEGGLGLSPQEYGFVYGFFGVAGLLLGGFVGGILASQNGLKKWLWPFVFALTLPNLVYVYMSYALPSDLDIISIFIFVEQFGYGLGFTALTLYMLYFSQGEFKTSHYAICTGLSYLGLMIPGMFSGWLKDEVGYRMFFIVVMASCVITFAITAFLKIDPEFGKKAAKTEIEE